MSTSRRRRMSMLVVLGAAVAAPVAAAVAPGDSPLEGKLYRHPSHHVPVLERPLTETGPLARALGRELVRLGARPDTSFYDWRADRWGSLVVSVPLLPGSGVGNDLGWEETEPRDEAGLQQRAWEAVRGYLRTHEERLRVDLAELPSARVGVFAAGTLIQVRAGRVVRGIPVRAAGVSAVLNHGNLVLLGLERWGDVDVPTAPAVGAEDARARVADHLRPFRIEKYREEARLEIVALARGEDVSTVVRGRGYDYRLAWVLTPDVPGDLGSWEALVDARSGDLLAFEDKNEYAVQRVIGGVYPQSNDQVPPAGVEQPGWPMPYANVVAGSTLFTSSGGIVPGCVQGPAQTTLAGQFIRIQDMCGPVNETSSNDIDLGVSAGTNCVVPPGHSPGDTHAARTSFYELNRIIEQARGYLPGNAWLGQQLTSNVNLVASCAAFWNGTTVNFYQASGGCSNTGENASIVDHEWAHGLDNNGVNPNITNPAHAISDVYAILRQNGSCVAGGLLSGMNCGGYGDECDDCTGVRDLDWLLHRCDRPHGIGWILNGFTSAECNNTGPAPACPPSGQAGPCGRLSHCEGYVPSEAAWDLQFRDLRAAPFNYDSNTALELTTRLMYLAPQTLTSWYTCGAGCAAAGTCGCGATGGYMLTLAADDDNGNIADGTPHMSAIRAAFERHEIHCATPAVVDSGCAGGPTGAPVVTATPAPQGVSLSWTPVAGADHYDVYRTEGVFACDYGKARAGAAPGTTFLDTGLLDGRPYSYVVLPVGANPSCFGTASACATAAPIPGQNPCGVEMAFTQGASSVPEAGGPAMATVVLSTPDGQPTSIAASVDFATANGTASAGSDYASSFGTLTFPAGTPDGGTQTIAVPILDDATDEPDETFSIGLSNPAGGTIGFLATHTVTILDDDAPTSVSIADVTLAEVTGGTSTATFSVTLAAASGKVASVDFATADGTATAPADYASQTGALSFAPGVTARTVDVMVVGDSLDEPDETFSVNLSSPINTTIDDGVGAGTITDDDAAPLLAIADAAVREGQSGATADATFGLSLSAPSGQLVTVSFGTADGAATAGTDYQAAAGAVSFAPGTVSQALTVTVNGDDIREGDEGFLVNLTNPTNTTIDDGQAAGLIQDDDSWPELTHGQVIAASLRAQPGPAADADVYQLSQRPFASYEVVVDGLSGDVGPSGPDLDRVASDGVTVIQGSAPIGAGSSRSLRFENATAGAVSDQLIRVRAPGCGTGCGPEDVYRVRLYETTAAVARFNNSATQTTVMTLQNLSADAVTGNIRFWSPLGALLGSQAFALAPRSTFVINTSTVAGASGQSGSVTVASDAVYGAIAGKAVAVEPATGFTFDSPLVLRPR